MKKNLLQISFILFAAALFLLLFSCSGVLSEKQTGSIKLNFNPRSAITAGAGRAVTDADLAWSKVVVNFLQSGRTMTKTIENTGGAEIVVTHTAEINSLIKIYVDVYKTIDGEDVVVYKGESENFKVKSGLNQVAIKAVRLVEFVIAVQLPPIAVNWARADFTFTLMNGNKVNETLARSSEDEPINFGYRALVGAEFKSIEVRVYERMPGRDEPVLSCVGESGPYKISDSNENHITITAEAVDTELTITAGYASGETESWDEADFFVDDVIVFTAENNSGESSPAAYVLPALEGKEYRVKVCLYDFITDSRVRVCTSSGERSFNASSTDTVIPVQSNIKQVKILYTDPDIDPDSVKIAATVFISDGVSKGILYTAERDIVSGGGMPPDSVSFEFDAPAEYELDVEVMLYKERFFLHHPSEIVPGYFDLRNSYTVLKEGENIIRLDSEVLNPVDALYIYLNLNTTSLNFDVFDPRIMTVLRPDGSSPRRYVFCFRRGREYHTLNSLGITEDKFSPAVTLLKATISSGTSINWLFDSGFDKTFDDGKLVDTYVIDARFIDAEP